MDKNSQPPASPAAPAKVMPMTTLAAQAAATDGRTDGQHGTALPLTRTTVRPMAFRPVQQQPQPPTIFRQPNPALLNTSPRSVQVRPVLQLPTAPLFPMARPVQPDRSTKRLKIFRPPAPAPPKLPVYRPLWPSMQPEIAGSIFIPGNAMLPSSSSGTGIRGFNIQAKPSSPDPLPVQAEGSDAQGGGGSEDNVQMLDFNLPPPPDKED